MQSMPTIIGKYEIIGPLGHGGMGAVYKAFHPQLQRYVAIKLLLATNETDPDFIARFQHEARAVAQLRHPHIVQVFDFDIQDSRPYMVMEFVEGETLAQRLRRLHRSGQMLPTAEAVQLFQQLCSAVAYAHKQGMLHRDLKPQNVIVNPQNDAILTDFGLAKIAGVSGMTATNATVGTPHYMSPEQSQGKPVDQRSDMYSLGVMLYEMLAGKVPFDASTPVAVLMQHVTATPPPISAVNPQAPDELAQIALKAMAKDPEQRFPTVTAMSQAIAAMVMGSPVLSASAAVSTVGNSATSPETITSDMETILPPKVAGNGQQQLSQPTDDSETIIAPKGASPAAPKQPTPAAKAVSSLPPTRLNITTPPAPAVAETPPVKAPPTQKGRNVLGRLALLGLIVFLVLVVSGVLAFVLLNQGKPQPVVTSVGTLSFTDSTPQDFSHPANVVTGTFSGLAQPTGDATYFAWLCDSANTTCALLGPVLVDHAGKASLTKTQATNWLGAEDAQTTLTIKISQENTEPSSPPAAPSSHIVYSGKLAPALLLHIRHQISAFTKTAPFASNMTALDVGFGDDALLLQSLAQQLQNDQTRNDLASLHTTASAILSLIAGNQTGQPGPATGDDGFGMGTEAPACTSGLTTTYLPILIEHACYASMAANTPTLDHLFTIIQQTGANAAKAILAIQQIAQKAQQATSAQEVDETTLTQQAQQVLTDAYQMLANSEQMANVTLYPN